MEVKKALFFGIFIIFKSQAAKEAGQRPIKDLGQRGTRRFATNSKNDTRMDKKRKYKHSRGVQTRE